MNRYLFTLRVTVKDGERAFVTRDGRFERVLEPGRHMLFDPARRIAVELYNVVRAEFPADKFAVLKAARSDLAAELFELVEPRAGELAIVSLDGRPVHLVGPWQSRAFWKVVTRVDVERIDVASEPKVAARHLVMVNRAHNQYLAETVVENHEAGRSARWSRRSTRMRGCTVWCSSRSARRSHRARSTRCWPRRTRSTRTACLRARARRGGGPRGDGARREGEGPPGNRRPLDLP
jgi:hypothetical protein